jgi:hypothetical protein
MYPFGHVAVNISNFVDVVIVPTVDLKVGVTLLQLFDKF